MHTIMLLKLRVMQWPIACLVSLHVCVPDADIDASHAGLSTTTISARHYTWTQAPMHKEQTCHSVMQCNSQLLRRCH